MYDPITLSILLMFSGITLLLLEIYLLRRFWIFLDYYKISMYLGKILIPFGIVISFAYFYEAYLLLNDLPLYFNYRFVEISLNFTIILLLIISLFGIKFGLKNWLLRRKYMFNKEIAPNIINKNLEITGGYKFDSPTKRDKFSFIFISDFHAGSHNVKIIIDSINKHIQQNEKITFILSGGDLVSDGRKKSHWKAFFGQVHPILKLPFFAIPGNHDGQFISMVENWKKYFPYNYAQPENGCYYKIQTQNSIFFLLDIYNNGTIDKLPNVKQIQWLEEELENISDEIHFKFLIFHKSIYCSDQEGPDYHLEAILLPIIKKYKINCILTGHSHQFEHFSFTNPSRDFFICGGGGGQTKLNFTPADHIENNDDIEKLAEFRKKVFYTNHFLQCTIENNQIYITIFNKFGKKLYSTKCDTESLLE